MVSAEEKIRKAKIRITTRQPFFASLIMIMPIEESDCPTMCTDSKIILYNSEFVDTLSTEQVTFVIMHEILHCAMGHLWRAKGKDMQIWNIATDLAVNDIINNLHCDWVDMPEGVLFDTKFHNWSAEKIYDKLLTNANSNNNGKSGKSGKSKGSKSSTNHSNDYASPINHDKWDQTSDKEKTQWEYNTKVAAENMKNAGNVPAGLERIVESINKSQKDWKLLLHDFIQEEINDYSLMPPDRRFDEDFFMYSYSDTQEVAKDLLFFVDTSGSMYDKSIKACFSEINGAMEQFNRKLYGKLYFFDATVYDPGYDFETITDITKLKPKGNGGTSFEIIFDFLKEYQDNIAGVIILTDGYAQYPEKNNLNIPTLWIYTTHDNVPPFGMSTTIEIGDY